ncbi:MAG: rod shape-determining protein MreD [Bacteroidaceae bacterium]|nr:rod shape-determining protein MreD [Bacteroidaceae bacterium]
MSYDSIKRLGRMLLLVAIQLLILDDIHLFGYATPLLIGYMLISFRRSSTRISLLLWGGLTGFLFDWFSNTMGMGMAGMTLLAFVQPAILDRFMPKDETDKFRPTLKTMGLLNYVIYVFSSFSVLHFVFYFLEAFSLSDFWLTLAGIIVGSLLSTGLVVLIELIANERKSE